MSLLNVLDAHRTAAGDVGDADNSLGAEMLEEEDQDSKKSIPKPSQKQNEVAAQESES